MDHSYVMTTTFEMLPCNRGMVNPTNRGYHFFQKNEFGVVCVYCGKEA